MGKLNRMKVKIKRLDNNFKFEGDDNYGHSLTMDAGKDLGGNNDGFSPMQLLILGLGGCTGIDIVMILKKQKIELKDFEIQIEANKPKDKTPSLWEDIQIHFSLVGDLEVGKVKRAIDLSMEKYCSVAQTLMSAGAKITYTYKIHTK